MRAVAVAKLTLINSLRRRGVNALDHEILISIFRLKAPWDTLPYLLGTYWPEFESYEKDTQTSQV